MTAAHNNGRKADGVCERRPAAEADSAERCCSLMEAVGQEGQDDYSECGESHALRDGCPLSAEGRSKERRRRGMGL